jgi:hypothetical protein
VIIGGKRLAASRADQSEAVYISTMNLEKYINQVGDLELSQAFDESVKQLDRLDRNLLARLDGKRYAPGKWTVKETLQHIIDWERILSFRTLLFARKEGSAPQSVDGDILAANGSEE